LEKYDADKDGQLNDEEKLKAKEGAIEQAKHTREENLAKYDATKTETGRHREGRKKG